MFLVLSVLHRIPWKLRYWFSVAIFLSWRPVRCCLLSRDCATSNPVFSERQTLFRRSLPFSLSCCFVCGHSGGCGLPAPSSCAPHLLSRLFPRCITFFSCNTACGRIRMPYPHNLPPPHPPVDPFSHVPLELRVRL